MLPQFDWEDIKKKIPVVCAWVGARRSGKSYQMCWLTKNLVNHFDLVISFQGSVSCSPELREIIQTHWDERFLFDCWNEKVMTKLWNQQNQRLKDGESMRQILVIVDDISMDMRSREQLANLAQRGRHCGISIFISAVSYTVIPKSARRSLDFCFVFDLPMYSCKKILLQEFAKAPRAAEFYLQNIPIHTCLVLSTARNQELFYFKIQSSQDNGKFQTKSEELMTKQSDQSYSPNENFLLDDNNIDSE